MDELASEFDTAWKQALEWFFEPFLAFFFPSIHGAVDWSREPEFLDKELQQIVPEAEAGRGTVDKLVKVWTPEGSRRGFWFTSKCKASTTPRLPSGCTRTTTG